VNRIGRRIILCMLLIAALILVSAPDVLADDLTGQASIIDGDTLEIHGTRIRLWGIDAPESSQLCRGDDSLQYRCGAKAANDLDAFIARRPVSCLPISLDRYGRTVATCSVAGADLGDWLVRNGLALYKTSASILNSADGYDRLCTTVEILLASRGDLDNEVIGGTPRTSSKADVRSLMPLAPGALVQSGRRSCRRVTL
jgi:endonuclease YncB( thermonuclease family)